jgi:hypothetical protein
MADWSAGWPLPMRPRGPSWPPSFPPQGHWEKVTPDAIRDMFRRVFSQWGLPQAVRVDNGYPWGTPRDLPTELALWLIGLGVAVIWNPPAEPWENPKVERCQGVADAWAEPHRCAGLESLSEHLAWACRVQREEYPSIRGASRVESYPELMKKSCSYNIHDEPGIWKLDRVDGWLSQRRWIRRVGSNGTISMYGHHRSLGRGYRGQEVGVRFDGATRYWVVADNAGKVLAQFLAWELSQQRILSLAVGRKRCQRCQ